MSYVSRDTLSVRVCDTAILIPCHNEVTAIGKVIGDFRAAMPQAWIYVYDNNSTDGTADAARAAGAIVRNETRQGKGNVVRRMFADVDADAYVMVDGDDTYDASVCEDLIKELLRGPFDLVNGARCALSPRAYRPGHSFGNKLLGFLVRLFFGAAAKDMLSGYKVFSNRFVKSFPGTSTGFEIETELFVHALSLRMPVSEVTTKYRERSNGSVSKLRTISDGVRILRFIGFLIQDERPFLFFTATAVALTALSLLLGTPVVIEFIHTGLVPRLPTAVLATGLMLSGLLAFSCGLILNTVSRQRREIKRFQYLNATSRGLNQQGRPQRRGRTDS